MRELAAVALPLAGFYLLYRLMLGGSGSRSSGRSGWLSPPRLMRGRSGPFPYNPKSPASLVSSFVFAMVLSAQLVMDTGSFVASHVDLTSAGEPTARAVVTILVLVGCLLALIAALPKGINNPLLAWVACGLAAYVFVSDMSVPTFAVAAIAFIAAAYTGATLATFLQCVGIGVSYWVLSFEQGAEIVTLTVVMTMLMGALTLMLIAMLRTMNVAVVLGILVAVALVSGLALPLS